MLLSRAAQHAPRFIFAVFVRTEGEPARADNKGASAAGVCESATEPPEDSFSAEQTHKFRGPGQLTDKHYPVGPAERSRKVAHLLISWDSKEMEPPVETHTFYFFDGI